MDEPEDRRTQDFQMLKKLCFTIFSYMPDNQLTKATLLDMRRHILWCKHMALHKEENDWVRKAMFWWDIAVRHVNADEDTNLELFSSQLAPQVTALQRIERKEESEVHLKISEYDKTWLKTWGIGLDDTAK